MTVPEFMAGEHVSNELLVRLLDDELTGGEMAVVENHLAGCAVCRERFSELRQAGSSFDSFISSLHPAYSGWERQQLTQKLESIERTMPRIEPRWNLRRLGWGMTVAAALALGVLCLPHRKAVEQAASADTWISQTASPAFEVDGETFVALPYSNPDLPLSAPHVVKMQVPVSSLADAGIYIEPVGTRVSAPDRAVLANVLLGLDGQPLGVHVLSSD